MLDTAAGRTPAQPKEIEMKKIHDAFTPREYALAKTIDCVRSMHGEVGGMMEGLTPAQVTAVQEQLAKLHNKLLDASRLDSIAL
jgi:hypothetical protein